MMPDVSWFWKLVHRMGEESMLNTGDLKIISIQVDEKLFVFLLEDRRNGTFFPDYKDLWDPRIEYHIPAGMIQIRPKLERV